MKPKKRLARLARRRASYDAHGAYPSGGNPGKVGGPGTGHEMQRPGSLNK